MSIASKERKDSVDTENEIQLRVSNQRPKNNFLISFNAKGKQDQQTPFVNEMQTQSRSEMSQRGKLMRLVQIVSVGRNNYQHPRINRVRR